MDPQFLAAMRRLKHFRDLEAFGCTVETYFAAQKALLAQGVTLGWNADYKCFIAQLVNSPGAPGADTAIGTFGAAALAELLRDVPSFARGMRECVAYAVRQ